mmetsp:Transcript_47191/g.84455  ORF Transcript_47191/g.84455 Transcript_47191/m.84455 type:complete len:106 (-) Transcript_47191:293-610(-)
MLADPIKAGHIPLSPVGCQLTALGSILAGLSFILFGWSLTSSGSQEICYHWTITRGGTTNIKKVPDGDSQVRTMTQTQDPGPSIGTLQIATSNECGTHKSVLSTH